MLLLAACATSAPAERPGGWPAADLLFHREPRWLGSDAAYSVPLGKDRFLWLFGDTFIATSPERTRRRSVMIRNSVAVQTGADPTAAAITFRWRETAGTPSSFFPEAGGQFYWPLHGIRLQDGTLVLFFTFLHDTPGEGLGFAADGWAIARVRSKEVDQPVDLWKPEFVRPTVALPGIILGQSVLALDGWIYVLGIREPGSHAGVLARFRPEVLGAGRISEGEGWCGSERGWLPWSGLKATDLADVLPDAGPECSLHRSSNGEFLHHMSLGFGSTSIARRRAPEITGPWSLPEVIFRPPESDLPGILVYAGKAHPWIDAGRDEEGNPLLAATYASNTLNDLARLLDDTSLYYPRFMRSSVRRESR